MTAGLRCAGLVEKRRAQLLAVFRAELEDVADLDGPANFQWLAAFRAGFAGGHRPQIGPLRHLDVAFDGDVAQMEAVLIRAGGHVVRAAQAFVGVNFKWHSFQPCSGFQAEACATFKSRLQRQVTRLRAERGRTFLPAWPDEHVAPMHAREFGFVQLVVAANQNDDRLAVGDINERLDLAVRGNVVRRLAQRLDGDDAGRGEFFHGAPISRAAVLGMPLVAFSMFAA